MRLTVDTNVLLRAAILDDPVQGKVAADLLNRAAVIAVPLPVLCEFAWVVARGYRRRAAEILAMIRSLLASATVQVDRPAVEAGLAAEMDHGLRRDNKKKKRSQTFANQKESTMICSTISVRTPSFNCLIRSHN
jgi:predicted nucleic acid-binding protein